jgi:hypothetical protein
MEMVRTESKARFEEFLVDNGVALERVTAAVWARPELFDNIYSKVKAPYQKLPPCFEVTRMRVTH